MPIKRSKAAVLSIMLTVMAGLTGCAPRVQPVPVPVPVAPGGGYEQTFVDSARMQGDWTGSYDNEILDLGYTVCNDLTYRPEYVQADYYDYFVLLSVQYLCPEHQSTLYQLGY